MTSFRLRLARDERAATAIEYGLIAALVALVLVTSLGALRDRLGETFGLVASAIPATAP